MRRSWYYPGVFGIFLSLIFLCFPACHQQKPQGESLNASEPQLIGNDWSFERSTSSDDTLIWWEYQDNCIFTYNLESGVIRQVLKLPELKGLVGVPDIYGDKIVFISGNYNFPSAQTSGSGRPVIDADWTVSLIDLSTGEMKNLTTDDQMKLKPAINKDTVVWLDARNSSDNLLYDVYAYDLKTNLEKRLTSKPSASSDELALNDSWVVWRDGRNGETDHLYDIYAYNLRDNLEKRLTSTSSLDNVQINLCGNLVTWTDSRNLLSESIINGAISYDHTYNSDIYLYDLNNAKERRITSYPGKEHYPVMEDNLIVFIRESDERQGDVFTFNIKTGQEIQISQTSNAWSYPAEIYNGRVLWIDCKPRQIENGKVVYNGSPGVAGLYLDDVNTQTRIALKPPSELTSGEAMFCHPIFLTDHYIVYSIRDAAGKRWTYASKISDK